MSGLKPKISEISKRDSKENLSNPPSPKLKTSEITNLNPTKLPEKGELSDHEKKMALSNMAGDVMDNLRKESEKNSEASILQQALNEIAKLKSEMGQLKEENKELKVKVETSEAKAEKVESDNKYEKATNSLLMAKARLEEAKKSLNAALWEQYGGKSKEIHAAKTKQREALQRVINKSWDQNYFRQQIDSARKQRNAAKQKRENAKGYAENALKERASVIEERDTVVLPRAQDKSLDPTIRNVWSESATTLDSTANVCQQAHDTWLDVAKLEEKVRQQWGIAKRKWEKALDPHGTGIQSDSESPFSTSEEERQYGQSFLQINDKHKKEMEQLLDKHKSENAQTLLKDDNYKTQLYNQQLSEIDQLNKKQQKAIDDLSKPVDQERKELPKKQDVIKQEEPEIITLESPSFPQVPKKDLISAEEEPETFSEERSSKKEKKKSRLSTSFSTSSIRRTFSKSKKESSDGGEADTETENTKRSFRKRITGSLKRFTKEIDKSELSVDPKIRERVSYFSSLSELEKDQENRRMELIEEHVKELDEFRESRKNVMSSTYSKEKQNLLKEQEKILDAFYEECTKEKMQFQKLSKKEKMQFQKLLKYEPFDTYLNPIEEIAEKQTADSTFADLEKRYKDIQKIPLPCYSYEKKKISEEHMKKGVDHFNNQEYRQAFICYMDGLEVYTRNFFMHRHLGEMFSDIKCYSSAIEAFRNSICITLESGKLYTSHEENIELCNKKIFDIYNKLNLHPEEFKLPGSKLQEAKDFYKDGLKSLGSQLKNEQKEALHLYEKAVSANPYKYVYHRAMGAYFLKFERYEDALGPLQRAQELYPNDKITEMQIRYAQKMINNIDKAQEDNIYQNLGGKLAKKMEYIDKELLLKPDNPVFRLWKGNVYFNLGERASKSVDHDKATDWYSKAIDWYNKAIDWYHIYADIIPRNHTVNSAAKVAEEIGRIYDKKATIFCNLGRYEEALHCYDSSLKYNPGNKYTYDKKAPIFCNLGRYEEALHCYDSSLKYDPGDKYIIQKRKQIRNEIKQNQIKDFFSKNK